MCVLDFENKSDSMARRSDPQQHKPIREQIGESSMMSPISSVTIGVDITTDPKWPLSRRS